MCTVLIGPVSYMYCRQETILSATEAFFHCRCSRLSIVCHSYIITRATVGAAKGSCEFEVRLGVVDAANN